MRVDKDFNNHDTWKDFLRYNDIFGMAMKIEMLTRYSVNIHYYPGDKRLRVEVFQRSEHWPWTQYIGLFNFELSDKEQADKTEEDMANLLRKTLKEEREF